jgi:hypothetical protein
VTGAKGIDTVELFIGAVPCGTSDPGGCSIAPQGLGRMVPVQGGTWYRDGDVIYTSDVPNNVAAFHLEAGESGDKLQLVAVGLTNGVATQVAVAPDVDMPAKDSRQIVMPLEPANPLDGQTHQGGNYALVWKNSVCAANGGSNCEPASDCVAVEQWTSGTARRTFVVPTNDADCDGFPTLDSASAKRNPLECDPTSWDSTASSSDKSSCTVGAHTNGLMSCLLGGQACVDGVGSTSGVCVPLTTTYCLPMDTCSCVSNPDPNSIEACFDPTATAHLECVVYNGDTGTPCVGIGRPTFGALPLGGFFNASTKQCTGLAFADPSVTAVVPAATFTFPSATAAFTGANVKSSQGLCAADLEWVSGTFPSTTVTTWKLVDVAIENGKHMLIPTKFTFGACTAITATSDGIICQAVTPTTSTKSLTNCAM